MVDCFWEMRCMWQNLTGSPQVAMLYILTDRKPSTTEENPACSETTEKSPVDTGWWHLRLLSLCLLLYILQAPSGPHQPVQGACHLWRLPVSTLVWPLWLDEKREIWRSITAQGRYEGSWFIGFLSAAAWCRGHYTCPLHQAAACCHLLIPRDTRG